MIKKNFSGKDFLALMDFVFEKKALFRFKAYGHSMSPLIKDSDILTVTSLNEKGANIGDVVVFKNRYTENIIVHRLVSKNNSSFITKGDNLLACDGIVQEKEILGKVLRVERNGNKIWFGNCFVAYLSRFLILNFFLYIFRKIKISK